MDSRLALLASPLLGPGSWESTADALRARGHSVTVVAHVGPAPSSATAVVEAFVADLDPSVEWVLVAHSNAGLLVPAVARSRRVSGVVYVDARLPETGVHPMRPAEALAFLETKVDHSGMLPPWIRWWEEDLSFLFPTRAAQLAGEAEMRRLPLSYFSDLIDGTGCDELPSAYLAFGDGYAEECARAEAAGWPTLTMPDAEHLHLLVDPAGVAVHVDQLIAAIR
jgi:hypothetical protein